MKSMLEESFDGALAMIESIATSRRSRQSCLVFALLSGVAMSADAACTFKSSSGGISFSPFDPSVATTQTASTSATVQCTGGQSPSWQFSGTNGNAPLQMKHATVSFFIPYSVAASFISGGPGNQLWNITATVLGSNYQGAEVGSYSDLLTLTITP
jgi:Spore Coat Protein U domain